MATDDPKPSEGAQRLAMPELYAGQLEKARAERIPTEVELDAEGKVRFARMRPTKGFEGIEVKERVPLHVWKMPEEKKAWYFQQVLARLREKLRVEIDKVKKPWD